MQAVHNELKHNSFTQGHIHINTGLKNYSVRSSMACKRSSVQISSSLLVLGRTENAAGIEPAAFFDGTGELVILGLTRKVSR